jgi:hypothetical protein
MVPRAASALYTGRGELGERLSQVLSFDPSTPPIQQRTFVIVGIGGVGKSEVCLKFAEDHKDRYVECYLALFTYNSTPCRYLADKSGTGGFCGLTLRASLRPSRDIPT